MHTYNKSTFFPPLLPKACLRAWGLMQDWKGPIVKRVQLWMRWLLLFQAKVASCNRQPYSCQVQINHIHDNMWRQDMPKIPWYDMLPVVASNKSQMIKMLRLFSCVSDTESYQAGLGLLTSCFERRGHGPSSPSKTCRTWQWFIRRHKAHNLLQWI